MIVLDPDNTYNTIKLIPRSYNLDNTHNIQLYDEDIRENITIELIDRNLLNGFMYYVVKYTFQENKPYRLTVSDSVTDEIYFRGKVFTTSQSKQNYSVNG